jgi:isochorismate pyruvate lyase
MPPVSQSVPQPVPPSECADLDEIRAGMDAIDREIVALIARRVEYVRVAAKFRPAPLM